MQAVIVTGGKQYRVAKGDKVKVEKIEAEIGSTVDLDKVLLVSADEDVKVGAPFVDGAKVTAKITDQGRGDKIEIIKFKRRKHYRKQQGHRQYFTELEITDIAG